MSLQPFLTKQQGGCRRAGVGAPGPPGSWQQEGGGHTGTSSFPEHRVTLSQTLWPGSRSPRICTLCLSPLGAKAPSVQTPGKPEEGVGTGRPTLLTGRQHFLPPSRK